jgi:hypothetical protein
MTMRKHNEPLETSCKNFEEDLVLYYYREDSESDRRRVKEHLAGCLPCRRFLDDLHRLLPQMGKPKELPQSFWDSYYRETVAKLAVQAEQKHWWRNLLAPMRMWLVPAFGTAAVAVLAFGLVIGKGAGNFSADRTPDRIPNEILTDAGQLEFFQSMDMLESLRLLETLDGTNGDKKSS